VSFLVQLLRHRFNVVILVYGYRSDLRKTNTVGLVSSSISAAKTVVDVIVC